MEESEELLVEVRRGPYLESVHHVSACVVTANGNLLRAFGDPDRVYPIRSLAKPFIAAELVRTGACEKYGLGDVELALASGSHDGEPDHVSAVRRFLAKIGLSEDVLLCGPALEGKVTVGPPIKNNCSGKHAAVLAMCCHLGLPTDDYVNCSHPIQQYLLPRIVHRFAGTSSAELATDGCSMPIFGASLRQIAIAYAQFANGHDPSEARVRAAIFAEPAYLGGWASNLDTQVISWSQGTVIAKIGAEGLHADGLTVRGIGIAVKVRDGNSRAIPPILGRLLQSYNNATLSVRQLSDFAERPIFNAAGLRTGSVTERVQPPAMGGVPMT